MNYNSQYNSPYVTQAVAHAPDYVRAEFIRKTYSLFFFSMLITVGIGWFCAQPSVLPAIIPLLIPLLIGGFVVGLVMAFTQRTPGLNLAMLCLYAAIQGAIAGPVLTIVNRYAPGIPVQAGLLTIAVFGGLTFYAITSKKDFSFLGGMLMVGLIGLIVSGLVMMFFHTSVMSMIYSLFGILIFSGFVLYDTSNIMQRMTPGMEVTGAIALYLDFINLFYFILRLLSEMNRR
jgi:FtsH-binding integral membrane protein